MNRGANHQKIFSDESDYQYLLKMIKITQDKYVFLLHNFPKRNRIIAALADEIYVVETGKKSGSLITAEYGAKYGRKVYVYNGQNF